MAADTMRALAIAGPSVSAVFEPGRSAGILQCFVELLADAERDGQRDDRYAEADEPFVGQRRNQRRAIIRATGLSQDHERAAAALAEGQGRHDMVVR
jgi:hypothetical protein